MPETSVGQPVQLRRAGSTLVLSLTGELDLFSALGCAPQIDRALFAQPPRTVADLRGVTFIDCSGLALLLRVRTRVARWGGEFALHCPDRAKLRILRYVDVGEPLRFVEALPGDGAAPAAGAGPGGGQKAGIHSRQPSLP
ncbi:STAS domain-containing protein [Streptomyces sp. NPDC058657]|uniref:STAS domain-containing protein n=1 Tax=unclassified Streptomyces TaxID=2593676 RepID=UPI0036554B14